MQLKKGEGGLVFYEKGLNLNIDGETVEWRVKRQT